MVSKYIARWGVHASITTNECLCSGLGTQRRMNHAKKTKRKRETEHLERIGKAKTKKKKNSSSADRTPRKQVQTRSGFLGLWEMHAASNGDHGRIGQNLMRTKSMRGRKLLYNSEPGVCGEQKQKRDECLQKLQAFPIVIPGQVTWRGGWTKGEADR